MAKKHKKKATTHRRRRMGGVRTKATMHELMQLGGLVAGGALAGALQKRIPATVNGKIVALGQVGVGVFVSMKFGNPFMHGLGLGMAAVGATSGLHQMGIINGIGDVLMPGGGDYMINGISNGNTLNGISNGSTLGTQYFPDDIYNTGAIDGMTNIGAIGSRM